MAGALLGAEPRPPFAARKRPKPDSLPEWEAEELWSVDTRSIDGHQRRSLEASIAVISNALSDPKTTWRQVFHLLQRHTHLYGIAQLAFAHTGLPAQGIVKRLQRSPNDGLRELGRLNHRLSVDNNVATELADAAVTFCRRMRAAVLDAEREQSGDSESSAASEPASVGERP